MYKINFKFFVFFKIVTLPFEYQMFQDMLSIGIIRQNLVFILFNVRT